MQAKQPSNFEDTEGVVPGVDGRREGGLSVDQSHTTPQSGTPRPDTPLQRTARARATARHMDDSAFAKAIRGVAIAPGQAFDIGRDTTNAIVLDDPQVAPRQAHVATDATGQTEITNLGDASAVHVNGHAVSRALLGPGAEVTIGGHNYTFTGTEFRPHDTAHAVRVDAIDVSQSIRAGLPLVGKRKVLLDDVSITLLPGSFVAIVGASGSGKTTLLYALSGQTRVEQGHVFYNGRDVSGHRNEFCTTMGYVPQDDIIHEKLSVEAALTYAARLRLPRTTSRSDLRAQVRSVLEDVELTDQHAQRITDLSGGQRKRVNIALELLARPAIFYLDEPTSGLDPGLDQKMMQLLRRLADRGQTVVLVTHATSNIDMCDEVCFLAPGGRLAYFGPPPELKQFFQSEDYASIYNQLYEDSERWIALYRQSTDFLKYVEGPRLQSVSFARVEEQRGATTPTWLENAPCEANSMRQFSVLTQRYVNILLHDPVTLAILLLQAPIIAALVWLLAKRDIIRNVSEGIRSGGPPDDIYAQRVLFIIVASAIWFGIINAAREIVKEAPVFQRERAVNLRLLPYVFSKVAVLGMLLAIQDAILLFVVGTKTGYPTTGLVLTGTSGAFIELYISLLVVSLVGMTMGLLVSALVPNTDRAVSIVPVLLIPQLIFASVIFVLNGALGRWISYVMPARWGMQATGSIAGLTDRFTDHSASPFYASDPLHLFGFWFMLLLLAAGFFGLTVFAMHARNSDK